MKLHFATVIITLALFADLFGSTATAQTKTVLEEGSEVLAMPEVPQGMDKRETLAYLINHFWDNLDFDDTARTHNKAFMEQNFANFAFFINGSKDPVMKREGVKRLMERAAADKDVYTLISEIAEIYLYSPDSPLFDEDSYLPFLEILSQSELLPEAERGRKAFLFEAESKNRQGTKASCFSFATREGETMNLKDVDVKEKMLLIFYNPDCENCHRVMGMLGADPFIEEKIKNGRLTVVAIYSGDDTKLWERDARNLPKDWIVGHEPGIIDEEEIYFFREFPSIYLLDADKTILIKNLQPSKLASELSL